jgi:amino acid adenylation domain-containing protein/non-ribosomal peptide synthase protein (TIGR01720 family)
VQQEALAAAIRRFLFRNEGIRMRLTESGGDIRQYAADYNPSCLDYADFGGYSDPQAEFDRWAAEQSRLRFTLLEHDLFSFTLFRIKDSVSGYLVRLHHLIADGWTMELLTAQISEAYTDIIRSGPPVSLEPFPSYTEYIAAEAAYLGSRRFVKDREFWRKSFESIPAEWQTPSAAESIKGERRTFELDAATAHSIRALAQRNKVSPNVVFVFLYLLYSNKMTGQTDMVVGTPVVNRAGKRAKVTCGMFTNAMPFRFTLDESQSIQETLKEIGNELSGFYRHQHYPYEQLAKDLELRRRGIDGLYQVCVNYYNNRLSTAMDGMRIENKEFYNGFQPYALQWIIREWSDLGKISFDIDYQTDRYSGQEIEAMFYAVCSLIKQMVADESVQLKRMTLLSEQARHWIQEQYNSSILRPPSSGTVVDLMEQQAQRAPGKIALRHGEQELSYGQLHEKGNRLARSLRRRGVQKEDIIGILCTHSFEMMIAILGVLKAGAAYLPIDIAAPSARTRLMLQETGCRLLLTDCDAGRAMADATDILELSGGEVYAQEIGDPLRTETGGGDLAYVMYTSGSTGRPKGVMVEHRSLSNYIQWAREMYTRNPDEVFALYTSLAFDLTVTSIFTPLIAGHQIEIYDPADSEPEFVLYRILKKGTVTILKLTPSHLTLLRDADAGPGKLRALIVGGEQLSASVCRSLSDSWQQQVEIYNEYGPTEATVGCMIYRYSPLDEHRSVPIGVPARNMRIYLLDKHLNLVPPGVEGELYISGAGLARGYLQQPALTEERFVPDPFMPDSKMYATGDLGIWSRSGSMLYRGRADRQIKVRGHRIELAEIEAALLEQEGIRQAIVALRSLEDCDRPVLCAYIVIADNNSTDLVPDAMQRNLRQRLPEYMVPAYICAVNHIPLTLSGKADIEALALPRKQADSLRRPFLPMTAEESILQAVMREVLHHNALTLAADFYELGGDSISAIQVSSKVRERGYRLSMRDIMEYPQMEAMAGRMIAAVAERVGQERCTGYIKPTPITRWFMAQAFPQPGHYNQSVTLHFRQPLRPEVIEAAFRAVVGHHDMLRVNYDPVTGLLFYNERHADHPHPIRQADVSGLSPQEQKTVMTRIGRELKSGFDLARDLLIAGCLFQLAGGRYRLLLTAHHLTVDALSWRIMLADFNTALEQLTEGKAICLPNKTHAYQRWAEGMNAEEDDGAGAGALSLPAAGSGPEQDHCGENQPVSAEARVPQAITDDYRCSLNQAYHTHMEELLLIALAQSMTRLTRQELVQVELESHGRQHQNGLDISRTVGWFTAMSLIQLKVPSRAEVQQQIKSLKEQIRCGLRRERESKASWTSGRGKHAPKAVPDELIRFNYLGQLSVDVNGAFYSVEVSLQDDDLASCNVKNGLLELNSYLHEGCLHIKMRCGQGTFQGFRLTELLQAYIQCLLQLFEHCHGTAQSHFTPSDFDTADLSQADLDFLFGFRKNAIQ